MLRCWQHCLSVSTSKFYKVNFQNLISCHDFLLEMFLHATNIQKNAQLVKLHSWNCFKRQTGHKALTKDAQRLFCRIMFGPRSCGWEPLRWRIEQDEVISEKALGTSHFLSGKIWETWPGAKFWPCMKKRNTECFNLLT